jgi:hypothetical protein
MKISKHQASNALLLLVGLWTLDFGLWTSFAAQNPSSGTGSNDYRNFEVIAKKNIFNPHRSPIYVPRDTPQVVTRTESVALVGVMSYGKGPMAFFDGSRTDYRRVLKTNDSIAGFKVTAIEPSSVKLAASTNEIELQVGMQLAREQQGEWKLSMRPESLETFARATPMRSASQVNSDRASEADQNNGNNNPFGAIGNFLNNGGFRGNGFPGGGFTGFPTATPPATQTAPTPADTTPAAPAASPDDLLARMAARAAADRGEAPANPQTPQAEPSPNQQPDQSPNQPGQSPPNQQPDPSLDPATGQPLIQRGEQPPNQ